MAPVLLEASPARYVLADKANDSDALVGQIVEQGAEAVIPSKAGRNTQRDYDRTRYKQRNIVERFFGRIKHYRRVATRYDKTVRNYFTAVTIVSILLWL
jgi:transposase